MPPVHRIMTPLPMSAPVTCRHCGETFTTTGTVNGQDAATWAYLQHLRENHGED